MFGKKQAGDNQTAKKPSPSKKATSEKKEDSQKQEPEIDASEDKKPKIIWTSPYFSKIPYFLRKLFINGNK